MGQTPDKLSRTLLTKEKVITRSTFWKIPHSDNREDISLKIGRYKKDHSNPGFEDPDVLMPKSELTLTHEEFLALISFIQDHYEPFKKGIKSYIQVNQELTEESADNLRDLFSKPDLSKITELILDKDIIPERLTLSIQNSRRLKAIKEFEEMLESDWPENHWQKWFTQNDWILGSQFVRTLDERVIDTGNIADFLLEAYDGFVDIVEIKRPNGTLKFWASQLDHNNYIPSSDLIKAITQSTKYIYEVEREMDSTKFINRIGAPIVKPRCILIYGRSNNWNADQREAYRILNSAYHNISILTFDHVLFRAKKMLGIN